MKRRAFLKDAALAGAYATVHAKFAKAEGYLLDPQTAMDLPKSSEAEEESRLAWGVNSIVLKPAWSSEPSAEQMFSDDAHTVVLDKFFRVGADSRPSSRTSCYVAFNDDALFVGFRCSEHNMDFPYAHLDPKVWRETDWYSMSGLPSATNNWPPCPDEVDLLIQPDAQSSLFFQFAATPQNNKFSAVRSVSAEREDRRHHSEEAGPFEATVIRKSNEWQVFFKIPWKTLGAKPDAHFGLLPMRTRWRNGEFTSPVAIDINESLPLDLMIETFLFDPGRQAEGPSSLVQTRSGRLRWQRPLAPPYPGRNVPHEIWRMQASLGKPTTRENLGERLYLSQRWMDLMMLEGFTPLPNSWGILDGDLSLPLIRMKVNASLGQNDVDKACQDLDTWLGRMSEMSKWWYADNSPANIQVDEWKKVTELKDIKTEDNQMVLQCVAGGRDVDLRLALPSAGGVRIFGKDQGYWKPAELRPLHVTTTGNLTSISTSEGKVVVQKSPFSISLVNLKGQIIVNLTGESLAFRFNAAGDIIGTDVRHALALDESIYGFGEKYECFNQYGHVTTLWGTDDWVGNGVGLANTTYKPLPILHSSRGCMVFSNSSYRFRADVGVENPAQCRLTQLGPIFDYYFWIGAPEITLKAYTDLTGKVPLPPKWAFEPWMGRGEGAWAEDAPHNPIAQEKITANRFADLDIPHSAIYAEGETALSPEVNEFMSKRNVKVLGYFMPAISPARQRTLMPETPLEQLPILHAGSAVETSTLGYIDFSNPNAMELVRRAIKPQLDAGVHGSMVDYGDLVPGNAVFHDGKRGAEMHNFYYYEYHKTINEAYDERLKGDFVLYARGAAPGTQHWVGQFAGDHPANFEGLRHVLTGALNLCACGYSNWGSDLGGYFGYPQPAVYMRWFQFGCFSPWMRPHGTAPRDPWYFGDAAVENYKFLAWTRENILNYTYNAAVIAHETGLPIMRSMPVAFPDDKNLAYVGDQYMFGPSLLVAPVLDEELRRMVSFPSGVWTNLWDGKQVSGPVTIWADAPLNTIPVYLKAGAVVPVQLGPGLQFGASMTDHRVDALVTTIPSQDESVSMLNASGKPSRVSMSRTSGGYRWSLEDLPEMRYLLLYGASGASKILVDGKELSKSEITDLNSISPAWQPDSAKNRLIVRLPPSNEQSERTIDITITA